MRAGIAAPEKVSETGGERLGALAHERDGRARREVERDLGLGERREVSFGESHVGGSDEALGVAEQLGLARGERRAGIVGGGEEVRLGLSEAGRE